MVNAMYRILIVEDDESIARSVKTHLESWNYEVCCAEDFSNVAGTFAAFDPQLVLMDVKLPFFNGYHWCSEIRKVSKVPVIFVSSASDNMNIVMAVSMGGDDFIAKPFDLEVLHESKRKEQRLPKRAGYEEMLLTRRELEDGMGESLAYERFGERCGLASNITPTKTLATR